MPKQIAIHIVWLFSRHCLQVYRSKRKMQDIGLRLDRKRSKFDFCLRRDGRKTRRKKNEQFNELFPYSAL